MSDNVEQWLGLHNVHQHQPISQNVAGETTQGWICTESEPCRLCLAAEVEALRAQVQRIQELRDEWSRDDAESLTRFGHHMPIALGAAAEMLTRATSGGAA